MRRGPLVFIAMLPFTTFASAQSPVRGETNVSSAAVRGLWPSRHHANQPGYRRRSSDVIRSRQRRSGDQGRTARSDAQPACSDATGGALDLAAIRALAMTAPRRHRGDWSVGSRAAAVATHSVIRSASQRARTLKERWKILAA